VSFDNLKHSFFRLKPSRILGWSRYRKWIRSAWWQLE